MFLKLKQNKDYTRKSAFTIIEALVLVFIMSVIMVSFYSTWGLAMKHIAESKNRMGATALANGRMEIVRNLKYDDIGVQGGIPDGNILADEDVIENGKSYHIRTFVQYFDDAFDAVFPDDAVPNDYKRVKITVTWGGVGEVNIVSRFVPPGLEMAAGEGVLSINIIDSQGVGVPQADVQVINNDIIPSVNISAKTDNAGNLMFPGAKESTQKYQVIVSKSGYETVATVDPATVPTYNPVDTHASVSAGSLNTKVIIQDKVSSLKIRSVDQDGVAIPSVIFDIKGGRILGAEIDPPNNSVYNLDEQNRQTDASGEKNYDSLSPGQYDIYNISTVSGYTLIGINPVLPFLLDSEEDKTVQIKFADDNMDALLVRVADQGGNPLNSATVKLTNGTGYDSTQTTLSDGAAYFLTSAGDYTLDVSAESLQSDSSAVTIDKLTSKNVNLNPIE